MRRTFVVGSDPPSAIVAVRLPDDELAVMIPKPNVHIAGPNPPFSGRTSHTPGMSRKRRASRHRRNCAGISNANTLPSLSVIGNVRIALGVIRKRDALLYRLPAIGKRTASSRANSRCKVTASPRPPSAFFQYRWADLLGTHYVPSFVKSVEAGKEMLGDHREWWA